MSPSDFSCRFDDLGLHSGLTGRFLWKKYSCLEWQGASCGRNIVDWKGNNVLKVLSGRV